MGIDLIGPLTAWPLMLLAAWLAGEWVFRQWHLPRVSAYGLVGLAFGGIGMSQNVAVHPAPGFIASLALALTLFELGYRVNPRWFRHNPWVLVSGLVQALLTFGAVFWISGLFDMPLNRRLVLASLCVATSPAAIMRVTHELRSAGQVTERLLGFVTADDAYQSAAWLHRIERVAQQIHHHLMHAIRIERDRRVVGVDIRQHHRRLRPCGGGRQFHALGDELVRIHQL